MTVAARIAFEDMIVAQERLARLSKLYPQRRTLGPGKVILVLAEHRGVANDAASFFADTGGEGALSDTDRESARSVARSRLRGDKEAGVCLCALQDCRHPLTGPRKTEP